MVDALVELVLHPGAGILARQQPDGAGDQIVEIEEAARRLQLLVAADQPVGDGQRGARALQHAEQRQPVASPSMIARGSRGVALRQVGQAVEQRLLERLDGS